MRIDSSTICGTDLHILKGDVPTCLPGTILGHEATATIVEKGSAVTTLEVGDRVLVSCITSCGRCRFCRERRYGHVHRRRRLDLRPPDQRPSGRVRARAVRRHVGLQDSARSSSDEEVLFLADILPTAYEVGVLNGRVEPGDTVAIVGAGPIGLAAIMTAGLYTPAHIVAIDIDDSRLARAREFGADVTINNSSGAAAAVAEVMKLTGGLGADVAIEAVGVPATFELCTELVRPGGRVANVGVHGHSATLHLETLWIRDLTITTGLVDAYSTPRLLELIAQGKLNALPFATHHFPLDEMMSAYETFGDAAKTQALKVVLAAEPIGDKPKRPTRRHLSAPSSTAPAVAVDVILRDGSTLRLRAPARGDAGALISFFEGLSRAQPLHALPRRAPRRRGARRALPRSRFGRPRRAASASSPTTPARERSSRSPSSRGCAIRPSPRWRSRSRTSSRDAARRRGCSSSSPRARPRPASSRSSPRCSPRTRAMLSVFRDAGFEVSRSLEGGEVEVRFPIARDRASSARASRSATTSRSPRR